MYKVFHTLLNSPQDYNFSLFNQNIVTNGMEKLMVNGNHDPRQQQQLTNGHANNNIDAPSEIQVKGMFSKVLKT